MTGGDDGHAPKRRSIGDAWRKSNDRITIATTSR
jgi:hypothetical protein